MIRVENKRTYHGPGIYVGRPSPLGNPFKIGEDGDRKQVISKYLEWITVELLKDGGPVNREFDRLAALAQERDVVLVCWCAPLECHADVIKGLLDAHAILGTVEPGK